MCDPATFTAMGMTAANAATAASVASTIGTIASVGGTILGTMGAINQSKAAQDRANYQAGISENNRIIAERRAKGQEKEGELAAQQQRLKARQLEGRQLVTLVGQGDDPTLDENVNLLAETQALGEQDAQQIKRNAERAAFNTRVEAANFGSEAVMSRATADAQNPLLAGGTTALSGFGQVANQWYRKA